MSLEPSDLLFRTNDMGKWGAGKGANLLPGEIDLNFWVLLNALIEVQESPTQPLQIQSITVLGNQMTVTLSDGVTTFGPFNLPVAAFRWRDSWAPDTAYKFADFFTANEGMYLVLQDHISDDTFNPAAGNMIGAYAQLVFPFPNSYDLGFFFPGIVGAGIAEAGTVAAFMATRAFYIPGGFGLSRARVEVAPADGDLVFLMAKNGVPFGALTFSQGETIGTFLDDELDIQFAPGDRFQIVRDGALDSSASDMSVTIAALKGLVPDEEPSESESA